MSSFNEIVTSYASQVYNHSLRLLGNIEDAEEATQDVFLKIHNGLKNFRGDSKLSTWIWRITTNVCYTYIAKKRLKFHSLPDFENNVPAIESISDMLLENEKNEIIAKQLDELSPHQANALLLFYFDGLNYKEIAEILEMPEGTIATLLHRGRNNLKKKLEIFRKENEL